MPVDYVTLKKNFVETSLESLENSEKNILLLEKEYNDELVSSIFRSIHSIKGSAGMFELDNLSKMSHVFENYLSFFRKHQKTFTFSDTDLILKGVDVLRDLLKDIDNSQNIDCEDLIKEFSSKLLSFEKKIDFSLNGDSPSSTEKITKNQNNVISEKDNFKLNAPTVFLDEAKTLKHYLVYISFDLIRSGFSYFSELRKYFNYLPPSCNLFKKGVVNIPQNSSIENLDRLSYYFIFLSNQPIKKDSRKIGEIKLKNLKILYDPTKNNEENLIEKVEEKKLENNENEISNNNKDYTFKIDIKTLEDLMTLVEEIILIRNSLSNRISFLKDSDSEIFVKRLKFLINSIKDHVYKIRLQDVNLLFNKLFRISRDAAQKSGKKIKLITDANNVKLDRKLLDFIESPLVHILRNAIDHGIETPEQREKLNKNKEGIIKISASLHRKKIVLEIQDDGKGLDLDKIKNLAIQRGLVDKDKVDSLAKKEIIDFIFSPGFSTAKKITSLSGRGVGMDVVLSDIKQLNGDVDIDFTPNKGSTFRISIPQTMSIVSCLILKNLDSYFSILEQDVEQIIKYNSANEIVKEKINDKKKTIEMYQFQDIYLPMLKLDKICNQNFVQKRNSNNSIIIIVNSDCYRFAILTDKVIDTEDVVIKHSGKNFSSILEYSGMSILGSGKIALILDIYAITNHYFSEESKQAYQEKLKKKITSTRVKKLFLVFLILDQKISFRTNKVTKIQRLLPKHLLFLSGKKYLNYRKQTIPIVNLEDFFSNQTVSNKTKPSISKKKSNKYLICIKLKDQIFALLLSNILEIIHEVDLIEENKSKNKFLLGSFKINDERIPFINLEAIVNEFLVKSKDT